MKAYTLTYMKMCSTNFVFEKPEVKVELAQSLLDMCVNAGKYCHTGLHSMYYSFEDIYC